MAGTRWLVFSLLFATNWKLCTGGGVKVVGCVRQVLGKKYFFERFVCLTGNLGGLSVSVKCRIHCWVCYRRIHTGSRCQVHEIVLAKTKSNSNSNSDMSSFIRVTLLGLSVKGPECRPA
jgi:hypothetical protein